MAPTMAQTIEDFLLFLSSERGASPNTVSAYRTDLLQVAGFIREDRAGDRWADLEPEDLTKFAGMLRAHNYAPSSISRKIAATSSFVTYLRFEGIVRDDLVGLFPRQEVPNTSPEILTAEEIERLLAQPTKRDKPVAKRDRALLELSYATGLGVNELEALDLADLYLVPDHSIVDCKGSGVKNRTIPVHNLAAEALDDYLENGRPFLAKETSENALFLNHVGDRLTRQGIWLIIKAIAKEAGLGDHITPNTLRHSFAAHLYHGGMLLRKVQVLLGQTNRYRKVGSPYGQSPSRKDYDQAHPRARK